MTKLPLKMALAVIFLALAVTGVASATSGPISVNIYANYNCCSGSGTPYSNFAGSFSSPDIMFATNFSYSWQPFGLTDYAADMKSSLLVATSGNYTFTLNSDDGSQLWIDGGLVVDDGGAHGPNVVSNSVFLTGGTHSLEVQFFECCGGPGGVDLTLPAGTSYTPEPSSLALLGTGIVSLAGAIRRKLLR